jgi:hypothetical protein
MDVGPTADERMPARALAIRHGLSLGLIATGVWYALWFALNIDVPGWAGLLFFLIAWALGCCLAGVLLQRQINQEMHRRTELVKLVRRRQTQTNSTT